MMEPEDISNTSTPVKWHQSLVAIVFLLVGGAVVTSPCWIWALLLVASGR